MITKVEAVNYRCLKSISQPLDRFQILAGPNGSGKSTFLEVLQILGAFASDGLESVWNTSRANQFAELLYFGQGDSFQLAVELEAPQELLDELGRTDGNSKSGTKNGKARRFIRYEVEIGFSEKVGAHGEPQILAENLWLLPGPTSTSRADCGKQLELFPSPSEATLSLINGQTRTPSGWRKVAAKSAKLNAYFKSETSDWNFTLRNPPQKSALSTLPEERDRFGLAGWAKSMLAQNVRKLMLRSERMQRPCPPLKERAFQPDGSTLPLIVRDLQKRKQVYQAWLGHVQTVLPIQSIEVVEREEDKHSYLRVQYQNGLKVPSWHLSDGTLRMLALSLLAYIESDGAVYLIEEPENGVHPPAVEAIYRSLNSIYGGQALVATHSPVLVGLIEPKQLLCFSQTDEGETDIVSGSEHPMLKNWQDEFRLAQLFASGILG